MERGDRNKWHCFEQVLYFPKEGNPRNTILVGEGDWFKKHDGSLSRDGIDLPTAGSYFPFMDGEWRRVRLRYTSSWDGLRLEISGEVREVPSTSIRCPEGEEEVQYVSRPAGSDPRDED